MENLSKKVDFPIILKELVWMGGKSYRDVEKVYKAFEFFDFHEDYEKVSSFKKNLTPDDHDDLDSLLIVLLYVAHLQTAMFLCYRTEDLLDMQEDIFDSLIAFFKFVKFDINVKLDETLSIMRESKVDNFSTQLSTEPSYAISRLAYIKDIKSHIELLNLVELVKGIVLFGFSYVYGTFVMREIYED